MEEKDYKKLYEDVVALAKDGLKDGLYLSQSAKAVTEFLFPQLKETEEEKARKGLVRFLINFNNGCYSKPSETEIDAWIKWINKKCEQKPVECIKFDNEFENQISHLIASVLNGEHEYNEGFVKYASQSLLGFANKDQNHTDKVKPKFKVGDWVVYNRDDSSREIIQVYDIRDGRYYFNDNIHFSWSVKECDEKCHLWTIQDAKDGDVLANGDVNIVLIFKCFAEPPYRQHIIAHIGLDASGDIQVTDEYWNLGFDCGKPATKEQCDILFQKMKKAGYEWDDEKKELRKIEQKPTPKFKIGDTIHKIRENTIFPMTIENIEDGYYVCKNGRLFVNIKYQDDYEIVEQKSDWSKEDEHCIELLLPIIDSSSLIPKNRKKCKEFLKSLKSGHWKPSEEQLTALKNAIIGKRGPLYDLYFDLEKL